MPWTVNYTRVVILGFGLHVCLKKQRRIEAGDPLIIRVSCNGGKNTLITYEETRAWKLRRSC